MTNEERLVFSILEWWKEHQYDSVSDYSGENYLYATKPEFVLLAEQIADNKELITCFYCISNGNQNKFRTKCTGCGADIHKPYAHFEYNKDL